MDGTITVEYAHAYVDEILNESCEVPDLTHVRDFLDSHDNTTRLVIVDDTNISKDGDFEEIRRYARDEWAGSLPITPDVVLYESHFTSAIEWFMNRIGEVNRSELNNSGLGKRYSRPDEGMYLYYNDGTGPRRARITDERADAKNTGYTCGAYDAAMTFAKLGELPPPDDRIVSDRAVTFHYPEYLGSPPFDVSAAIREFLDNAGIVEYSENCVYNVPENEAFNL